MENVKIIDIEVKDIRFPTSKFLDGSDAMNPDPDYSATYVVLHTDQLSLKGHGLTFTIGRGNEICVQAIESMSYLIKGKYLNEFTSDMREFWKMMVGDSQLRWLGPEKGVIHLATGALVNAVWDLYARVRKKPLWKLLSDMSPEELVSCMDFSYITDALTETEALELLKKGADGKKEREELLLSNGYPAYTTSVGWLGYSDEKILRLTHEALESGFRHIKLKVGKNLEDDLRRVSLVRKITGPDIKIMLDANQKWGVQEAIDYVVKLGVYDPWWIEEPTHPDDIIGHHKISKAIHPIKVATGEHCHNRIMFKQLLQSGAIDFCQIDCCRVAGVNELLSIILMAKKYDVPVCPHAGGVGLCEYVQHLSYFDYLCVSGTFENRVIEYVSHLHEHFVDPIIIRNGSYIPPMTPGFSIEMKKESLLNYEFPGGEEWQRKVIKSS
ncbi:MAG: L-fuconate dehydratase [Saprospiraceae bacterium]|nr:L-fuconate dehydratase [Saprospiraceae bacterium]